MAKASVPSQPNYADAIAYAFQRLRTELSPHLYYHNAQHTEEDVLPAVGRLARLSNVAEPDLRLLEVGAAFHDLGQIKTDLGHELIGTEIIAQVLPGFGFSPQEIVRVSGMILATRLPQSPHNDEQALLCDADLDSLGREDFFVTSKALWRERTAAGLVITWPKWLEDQLRILQTHHYFTHAAQALRQEGKQKNIDMLEQFIRGESGAAWVDV